MNNKFALFFVAVLTYFMSGFAFASNEVLEGMTGAVNQASNANTDAMEAIVSGFFDVKVNIDPSNENLDYFQIWLRYIYGSFIFEKWTGSPGDVSVLAMAIGFTNALAFFFGMVVLAYSFLGGAVNTASSGEVLGKNWSSFWMPVRTFMGLGLIMPTPTVGGGVFSLAQVGVLWLIITGANAANQLWSASVDKLVTTGNYYSASVPTGYEPYNSLVKSLICLDHNEKYISKLSSGGSTGIYGTNHSRPVSRINPKALLGHAIVYTGAVSTGTSIQGEASTVHETKRVSLWSNFTNDSGMETYTRRISDISSVKSLLSGNELVKSITFAHGCGSISFLNQSMLSDVNGLNEYEKATFNAYTSSVKEFQRSVSEALDEAWSVAYSIGTFSNGNPEKAYKLLEEKSEPGGDAQAVLSKFQTTRQTYEASANKLILKIGTEGPSKLYQGLENINEKDHRRFTKGGFAAAGLWFLEVGNNSDIVSSFHSATTGGFKGPTTRPFCKRVIEDKGIFTDSVEIDEDCHSSMSNYESSSHLMMQMYRDTIHGSEYSSVENSPENVTQQTVSPTDMLTSSCSNPLDCELDPDLFGNVMSYYSVTMLNALATSFESDPAGASVSGNFMTYNGLANPFKTLANIGHSMNKIAEYTITLYIAAKTMAGMFTGWDGGGPLIQALSSGLSGLAGGAVSGFVGAVTSLLFPIIVGMLASGFVLAYMIPLLPVITWVNMMVGYLITTVEAATAAPLAVIQLLTPEGQGIVGTRLERALQLVVVCILKPSLMIIGLLAAISISSIAFTIFSQYFWTTANNVLKGTWFIDVFALVAIFTTSALALTKLCVSIQYSLPQQILEWFAAGVGNRSFGEQEIGQSVQQSMDQVKGMSEKILHHMQMNKRHNDRKGKGGESEGGGDDETPAPSK
ncbi:DotA/TraY family protein [Vibrio splendidus]